MKFVLIQKQQVANCRVDVTTSAYYEPNAGGVVETVDIPDLQGILAEHLPKELHIKVQGKHLTEVLLRTITPAYLRGSRVFINGIDFGTTDKNPMYRYIWQDKLPSTLPEHLKLAYIENRLRGALYDELVAWNQSRVQKAQSASQLKWHLAEEFYKNIYKALLPKNIKVHSPNKKTFYEAKAEWNLDAYLNPQDKLTVEEETYLAQATANNLVKAFGLQDCSMMVGVRHRTTQHGTTVEPCIVDAHEIQQTLVANTFRRKNGRSNEGYTNADGFQVFTWLDTRANTVVCTSKQRENIATLKCILALDKDTQAELLMPGWHFCPVCGKLYHENEGCYENTDCHVRELGFVPYNENHGDEEDWGE